MVIVISNLRRPGVELDSSKLAILGNNIAGSIKQRTKGKFIASSTIQGKTISIKLKTFNPRTNTFSPTMRDEQSILAGRISSFLNENNVSHNIRVS